MIENKRALSVVAGDFEVARLWREARPDRCLRALASARFPHPPSRPWAPAIDPSTATVDNFVGNWWFNARGWL